MSAFEDQQIDRLEGQLADLTGEFYVAESDVQRRTIADRYEAVIRQLERAPSWCGEPHLDSQLPDEWMPRVSKPLEPHGSSGLKAGQGSIARKAKIRAQQSKKSRKLASFRLTYYSKLAASLRVISDEELKIRMKEALGKQFRLRAQAQFEVLDVPTELRRNRRLIDRVKQIQQERRKASKKPRT